MQLTVQDAAALLNVSDKTIYRWVKQKNMPAYKINDQIRFHRSELLEWATSRRLNVAPNIFEYKEEDVPLTGLQNALRAGGIYYRVDGHDVASVLKSVVDIIPLPGEINREFLLQVLLTRESLGSTGIGNGISIPHPRNPIIMFNDPAMVSLCFLEKPVEFNALDGKPVHALFVVMSPVIRAHLQLISRIAYALQNPSFMKLIQEQGGRDSIIAAAGEIDENCYSLKSADGNMK